MLFLLVIDLKNECCVAKATLFVDRVLAPEGELLSFASPKESNQRQICQEQIWMPQAHEVLVPGWHKSEGDPIAADCLALLAFIRRLPKGTPVPLATRGIPAAPLSGLAC
jgi:hypothetical protein